MERYEIIKDIGSGNFGVAKLVREKWTRELFAVKFIERGQKIDEHVQREIMNHRSLKHPDIIRFEEIDEHVQREIMNHRSLKHPNIIRFKEIDEHVQKEIMNHRLLKHPNIIRFKEIDEHVQREIMNHRSLKHPNIIRFKEVLLTPTHLAIVMEYAAGGEMFQRICNAGRFGEDEARFFFQQLISGVSYCHSMQICHRDLKLENTLLDGSTAPRVKICDFGYSKSSVFHSQPKSTVGTPAYIAPEVLSKKEYDGKIADVWSCGVTLYVMLVGAYPFEDPADPRNFRKTIGRILSAQYAFPDYVRVSVECKHLLSRIFVAHPEKRITIPEIKNHPWFLNNLPVELAEGGSWQSNDINNPSQSMEEVLYIIQEARKPIETSRVEGNLIGSSMDIDDLDADADAEDLEASGDFVCPM